MNMSYLLITDGTTDLQLIQKYKKTPCKEKKMLKNIKK